MSRRTRIGTFALALAGAWSLACATGPEIPEDIEPGYTETPIVSQGGMLIQRVTVTPARPTMGDTIVIRSALRNAGATPVPIVATICGVHLQGTLRVADPFVRCAGYSMTGELAPGDSVIDSRRVVVASPPGMWELEVRHLLEPSTWVSVAVEVRL